VPVLIRLLMVALGCAASFSLFGQTHSMPSASEYSASILPERNDVVSWKTLSHVRLVKEGARMVLNFSDEILALDEKQLRVQGFMIPLGTGQEQKHFLLSAVPPSCPFCVPAVAFEVVEVLSGKPVTYGFNAIVISGKFAVLKDDPAGVVYRMSDAVRVATDDSTGKR
jgi:uncharacterized protein